MLFELYAVTTGVAYSYNKGFTFRYNINFFCTYTVLPFVYKINSLYNCYSAWGEALFLLIQTAVVAVLVLHYNRSPNIAAIFVGIYSVILYILVGGLTPIDVLWSLQAISIPLIFAAKVNESFHNF